MKDEYYADNRKKYECMTGEEFRKEFGTRDEEGIWHARSDIKKKWRDEVVPHLKCLARSSPTDKQVLVEGIQKYSKEAAIVAVTGDGTNDCPALFMADVGFAMNTGSDAAKSKAKVVLIEDDFNSTLTCVKFGRNIYDSVQKFLQFQLTVNVVAIIIVLLGAVVLNETVLTSVQILWVNLIMDTFAALALATEPPTDELLQRPPTKKEESIVNNVMARNIIGWSFYQVIALIVMLFAGRNIFDIQFRDTDPFYWTKTDMTQYVDDCNPEVPGCQAIPDSCTIDLATGQCGVLSAATSKV